MNRLLQLPVLASFAVCLPLLVAGCDPQKAPAQELDQPEDQTGEPDPDAPDLCVEYAVAKACEDGEGTQFCDYAENPASAEDPDADPEILVWGECLVDFECMLGETRSCGLGEDFGDLNERCTLIDGVPSWDFNACNTPLVLSFDRGPIQTVASSAVFDISGAGMCLSTDWPAAQNPWLAIDLDKNGFIDGGQELFGSGSVLATGAHARNGFVALATLDSNNDGRISAADDRFTELLVWRDEDGDKRSLPSELSALADEGVHSLDLGFEVRELCDARGNCGRERSSFEFVGASGRVEVGELVDIYLACQ